MPDLYVPLDVNFQDDDRLLDVSSEAELIFIRSLAIAKRLLTDGRVTRGQARRLGDKVEDWQSAVRELVQAGLWITDGDGWRIPSWMKHNRSADDIQNAREAKSTGGSLGNHNKWHRDRGVTNPDCEHCPSHSDSHSDSDSDSESESGANPHSRDRVETETSLLPPLPPSGEGGAIDNVTDLTPRKQGANPRAKGQSPRQIAQAEQLDAKRRVAAANRGRSLAAGGIERVEAMRLLKAEYGDSEAADVALDAYEDTLGGIA